jgi:hypothetical protein
LLLQLAFIGDVLEVSHVRRKLKQAIDAARERVQSRRERVTEAERTYATFLTHIAIPVAKQVANALKVEGYAFTVFTPGGGLRLASDRGRDDFIDIVLDTAGAQPQVLARISFTRGSRTIDDERPIKPGAPPESLTEEDVLEFFVDALEPWLER